MEEAKQEVKKEVKNKKILQTVGAFAGLVAAFFAGFALLYTAFNAPKIAYESKVNAFKKSQEMDVYIKSNEVEKELYTQLDEKAKQTVIRKAKFEAIKELKKLNPNDSTILGIIKQCFEKTGELDLKKYGTLTLNLLFSSKKNKVLKCFKKEEDNDELVLVKMKDCCDYDFFGEKYQTCSKSEIK